jgi:hypothetical protein
MLRFGGENRKVSGVCNNVLISGEQNARLPDGCAYYCQCINGAATPSQLVTSVVNGQAVTATYSATTLSAYTDLRAVTTRTTSVSSG